MGSVFSSKRAILHKGVLFRQDLYARIANFRQKYHQEFENINPKLKDTIILMSALELVKMLQDKHVTSYQLVLIFAERSSVIGIQNNYVFEEMFEQAILKAKQYDQSRIDNPGKVNWKGTAQDQDKCFPPFYGIPASYKENIRLKGSTSHAGYIIPHQKNYSPQDHGLFAELTIRMGFIPFIRTNVPMSMKTIQTNNNMFGYAKNPWDQTRSCGGSSGGQGGLIGSYCSPMGFGTDIGGSVRIPAQWNGLVSIKPGARYSKNGNCFNGKISGGTGAIIKGEISPITRSVADVIMFMKFMCNERNYHGIKKQIMDPYLNLKPFSGGILNNKPKLNIGYIINLETLYCSASHARVVKQAVKILRLQGHEVKQIKMPLFQQLYLCMTQMYLADGTMRSFDELSNGEPLITQLRNIEILSKFPNFLKNTLIWALQKKQPRIMKLLGYCRKLSVSDTFTNIYRMQQEISSEVYRYFIDNDIQAVVMPGFAFPSSKLGTINKLQYTYSYLSGWNVINYPCGSIPMGIVQENQQFYQDQYMDTITKTVDDNMKQSQGMPVGVQIGSLPYKEEIVTYLMQTVEDKVQFRKKYPCKNVLGRKVN